MNEVGGIFHQFLNGFGEWFEMNCSSSRNQLQRSIMPSAITQKERTSQQIAVSDKKNMFGKTHVVEPDQIETPKATSSNQGSLDYLSMDEASHAVSPRFKDTAQVDWHLDAISNTQHSLLARKQKASSFNASSFKNVLGSIDQPLRDQPSVSRSSSLSRSSSTSKAVAASYKGRFSALAEQTRVLAPMLQARVYKARCEGREPAEKAAAVIISGSGRNHRNPHSSA